MTVERWGKCRTCAAPAQLDDDLYGFCSVRCAEAYWECANGIPFCRHCAICGYPSPCGRTHQDPR